MNNQAARKSRFDTYTEAQRLARELSALSRSLSEIGDDGFAKEVMSYSQTLSAVYDVEVIEKAN